MHSDAVLIEASREYARDASELLAVADLKPVRALSGKVKATNVLHQIRASSYGDVKSSLVQEVAERITDEVVSTQQAHRGGRIVFWVPEMTDRDYVRISHFLSEGGGLESASVVHRTSEAVVELRKQLDRSPNSSQKPSFVLDAIADLGTLGDDLRDDTSGKVDAVKVGKLFNLPMASIAKAAGIENRQTLQQNPTNSKAQPLLQLFERVARLRAHPQFNDPASFRKWFRRPLPMFSNHSAEDLFEGGKLELAAQKVDQLLTGDFAG